MTHQEKEKDWSYEQWVKFHDMPISPETRTLYNNRATILDSVRGPKGKISWINFNDI